MYLERLALLRQKNGYTQDYVSKILGVERTTYGNYETGQRQIGFSSLVKLADLYNVSLDYIFERTNNPMFIDSYTDKEIEFMTRTLDIYNDLKD
ncbi:helix-turn-helix domain-containing protein [Oceanobacillus iheyensis]|uniref:helix-turn-helix domain-containing protein n=1 Tax=Oceanobacillus iheyensis TaxID=182710 RepID=UPI00362E773C